MWQFKKKEPERDTIGEAIAELKEFRDVGETFIYLGRICIVTGHCHYFPGFGVVQMLKFNYCDNNGVIHSACAQLAELPGIIKQQKSSA